jgi:integrase/recombinase XerD
MSISPLRQRMIDDMTARHFTEKAQKDYVRCVKNLAAFIGRAPETATAEDLRLYRLHLVQSPLGAASVNSAMTALRFFFSITLDRYELRKPLFRVEQPRKLPTVLTQDEVARLLDAAPSAKYKAALSVAYGAGLRASEVVSLKVSDIDSARMLLRVRMVAHRQALGLAVSRPEPGQSDDHTPVEPHLPHGGPAGGDQQARLPAHAAT